MYFCHAPAIWRDYPELAAGVLRVHGLGAQAAPQAAVARLTAVARSRLAGHTEAEFAEVQAWRRAFGRMGIKATQYRCASEALLRRLRREGTLPCIHPLVDLCNAASAAFAIPVAALDTSRVSRFLEVRYATGEERYDTFAGRTEHPPAGEVIFADGQGRAHSRRWTNRQSGHSAVRDTTRDALIVVEALHETARDDVRVLLDTLAEELDRLWSVAAKPARLDRFAPRYHF